jgi:hypothetical protein
MKGTGYDLPSISQKRGGGGFQLGGLEDPMMGAGSFDPHASAHIPNKIDPNAGKSF